MKEIAMPCTQEQFDLIEPKLKYIDVFCISEFKEDILLVLFNDKSVTNGTIHPNDTKSYKIYEEWNEKIFLEACGIETEKTFSITESQIKEVNEFFLMHNSKESSDKWKEWFPEAFESEVKFEVGKWYKETVSFIGKMFVYIESIQDNNNVTCYGFNGIGEWFDSMSGFGTHGLELATEQEVFEALRAESLKRYKAGQLFYLDQTHKEIGYLKMDEDGFKYYPKDNQFFVGAQKNRRAEVFYQGVWREEIESITLSEAEQQLGKKIIV